MEGTGERKKLLIQKEEKTNGKRFVGEQQTHIIRRTHRIIKVRLVGHAHQGSDLGCSMLRDNVKDRPIGLSKCTTQKERVIVRVECHARGGDC